MFKYRRKKTWLIGWDLPAEGQPGERKKRGGRQDRKDDRQRKESTYILAILYRTNGINNNYPVAGELRILCTYILTDNLITGL